MLYQDKPFEVVELIKMSEGRLSCVDETANARMESDCIPAYKGNKKKQNKKNKKGTKTGKEKKKGGKTNKPQSRTNELRNRNKKQKDMQAGSVC